MRKIYLPLLIGALAFSCSSDDSEDPVEEAITDASSGAIVGSLALTLQSLGGSTSLKLGGVSDDYCSGSGGPKADGSELELQDTNYGPVNAHCVTTYNSQSSDTAVGALYWLGAYSCFATEYELFTGLAEGETKTVTKTIEIAEPCFGTAAQVAAMQEDMGWYDRGRGC